MLTLICGLPRAGKTTFSKQYNCPVIHFDEFGAPRKAYERVNKKLSEIDGDIVVEGIYNKAEQRSNLISAYNGCGTKCIWLNTPIEIKKTRLHYTSSCEYLFEPPTYDEGWDEIEVIYG